jgi:hypothetical protein
VCQRTREYTRSGDPVRDVDGIETHEAADLDVRNPALGDEPAHVSLRDAQTFRHRTDVQQRRELVHTSEWRVESRKRDQKLRVKTSSHTLHHDARQLHETVAKIGTDMPVALSATGRRSSARSIPCQRNRIVVRTSRCYYGAVTDDFRWPGRTSLVLKFSVRGPVVSPERITESTGIAPSRSFQVGEGRGRSATSALWQWESDSWTDIDTDPLFASALGVLGPHESVFAACAAEGAEVSLTAVGYIYGEVIATFEEAERRRFEVGGADRFKPFFSGDRVGISLDPPLMGFLSRIGASFQTHIDAELDDEAR